MLSRRDLLIGATAAGAATLVRGTAPAYAKAAQPSTPVNFDVPAGACDCHTHIFGDPARYAFATPRPYTPEPATVPEMRALHKALHTPRVIIVQPTVYGTDNTCTLESMKLLGPGARAVVVIDDKTPESALDDMARLGIRGIRINLETVGQTDPAIARQRFAAAVERIKARKWHIQIYTRLSIIESLKDQFAASPVPLVFDHFGGAQASLGLDQTGFPTLLGLVRSGVAYVKISGAYRSSTQAPNYPDVAPYAKALIAANPQRIVWGSDWPHPDSAQIPGRKTTDIAPLYQIDDGALLNQLPVWAPEASVRKTILVDTPAKLYGF
jgi:predicted TIM-barrel fold metal-dependent hydrolase